MTLHKLCANHVKLAPDSECDYNFATLIETKTLGVSWKPILDCFLFRVKVCLENSYTKRDVLSTIAKLFDPIGLMAPVIAKAKIFLQRLWRIKMDWNDSLPDEEYREWHQFLVSLESINNIEIPRRIFITIPKSVEIHGFADASQQCYGAAVYCKSKNSMNETLISLITSKSRAAPIKSLTIPRLELCAAVLLLKLVKRVVAALKLETVEIYLWTDSMIVLAWLQKETIDLKTFVQNRVATVQELFPNQRWRHVPTDENPADLVSRGVDPDKLPHNNLWFHGPMFLAKNDYPNRTINCSEKHNEYYSELRNSTNGDFEDFLSVLNIHTNNFINDLLDLSNNYITILRVESFLFRLIYNCKNPDARKIGPLLVSEVNAAEIWLIKCLQRSEFPEEIKSLEKGKPVPRNSKLSSLCVFLDKNKLMRVGGRLSLSDLPVNSIFPIILPGKNSLTTMILRYCHLKYLHLGPQALLYQVRQKFWPLNGRNNCRTIVHSCITCFKNKPVMSNQIMADLPKERTRPNYPFNITGIDFCGPFSIKFKNQRKGVTNKV
ncbi:uncharacterized protein [Parasteatoda tepidariorum]|uniref:uncharacterized protein n=1 Tax=Parasteatoda tepidariorum TaxID=114398 RepID=UPI0039BCF6AA